MLILNLGAFRLLLVFAWVLPAGGMAVSCAVGARGWPLRRV